MSSKNNVNPDHYKVAGRDRPDDAARARRDTQPTAKRRRKGDASPPNLIPGAAPVGERPGEDAGDEETRERR